MEAYCRSLGNNEYYEQVLRVIASLDNCNLKAFILSGHKWYEIDDAADKAIAETIFAPDTREKLTRLQKAFGGYWRYPALLDYCYLVNPYFPPAQMQDELVASFGELLTSYPSGLNTQNLLAAKLFGIDEEHILTGNGAAELIRALSFALPGSIGIPYPSFNEYAESFENFPESAPHKIIPFFPKDFSYTKDDLIAFSAQCDNLLLINPDNPSGNYLKLDEVPELAAHLKAHGKKLILDESFADFADLQLLPSGASPSLIQNDVLTQYPNMVIVKSLSKSYGIPGLRLGVLASSDASLIRAVRKHLSIWNINSFAEYALQIIGKYKKDYALACAQIATERARFKELLEKSGKFTVYTSQANYLLCRIAGKNADAATLAQELLEKNIFIKDLTGKKGIPDNSFIRLAVRNAHDNDLLIEQVTKLPPPPIYSVVFIVFYSTPLYIHNRPAGTSVRRTDATPHRWQSFRCAKTRGTAREQRAGIPDVARSAA